MGLEGEPPRSETPINILLKEGLGGQVIPLVDELYISKAYRRIGVLQDEENFTGEVELPEGSNPEDIAKTMFGGHDKELLSFDVRNGVVCCKYRKKVRITDGHDTVNIEGLLVSQGNSGTDQELLRDIGFHDEWALDLSRYLRTTYSGLRGFTINEWQGLIQSGNGVCIDFSIYKYLLYRFHPRLSEGIIDLRMIMYKDKSTLYSSSHYGLSYINTSGDLIIVPGGKGEIRAKNLVGISVDNPNDARQMNRLTSEYLRIARVARELCDDNLRVKYIDPQINEIKGIKARIRNLHASEI